MLVTQDGNKKILRFLEEKIDIDEMWAEAFSKLIGLDEPDQNGSVWDMLEAINDSMRWDELFEQHPEVLDQIIANAKQEYEQGLTIPLDPDAL